jgi:hypothetical protein
MVMVQTLVTDKREQKFGGKNMTIRKPRRRIVSKTNNLSNLKETNRYHTAHYPGYRPAKPKIR